jgi:Tfp pilus assembly protein PilF
MRMDKALGIVLLCFIMLSCSTGKGSLTGEQSSSQRAEAKTAEGLEYLKNGKYQKAEKAFEEAVQLDDSNPLAHARLGWALFVLQKFDRASNEYKRAVDLDPNCKQGHLGLGYVALTAEDYDQALKSIRRALEIDKRFAAAHTALGRVYHKQGLIHKAIMELEEAIALDPDEIAAYYLLSEIYEDKAFSGIPEDVQRMFDQLEDNRPRTGQ